MKYTCKHCKKEFDIPATINYRPVIVNPPQPTNLQWPFTAPPIITSYSIEFHTPCCPFCYSIEIEEKKE